jgi:hypothetical protein
MSSITIKLKDGTVREFPHTGRPGGSATKTLKLENGFATVTNEWDERTSIPAADIAEIVELPSHRY